jgi:hypothetical protein
MEDFKDSQPTSKDFWDPIKENNFWQEKELVKFQQISKR